MPIETLLEAGLEGAKRKLHGLAVMNAVFRQKKLRKSMRRVMTTKKMFAQPAAVAHQDTVE